MVVTSQALRNGGQVTAAFRFKHLIKQASLHLKDATGSESAVVILCPEISTKVSRRYSDTDIWESQKAFSL